MCAEEEGRLGGAQLIQVDIGGHPPIPLEPPPFLLSVFQFFHSLLFLAVFSGPELPGPF
jgi:hypothetical protein